MTFPLRDDMRKVYGALGKDQPQINAAAFLYVDDPVDLDSESRSHTKKRTARGGTATLTFEVSMWEKIDYKGFEIWVLPILAYGPPTPNTPYHYNGYVCRPGADLRHAGQRKQFYELGDVFATEAEALDAAYREGRDLVDSLVANG